MLRGWKRRLNSLGRHTLDSADIQDYTVTVIAVDDATISELNTRYLDHPWTTDVIAFTLQEPSEGALEGEVYICCDTARRQATEYNVKSAEEFARLTVHGLLHLCGWEDNTPKRKQTMRRQENKILSHMDIALGSPDSNLAR